MPRPEKVQAVAEIKERLERANAVFLAEYAGLSVKQQQALRRGLRDGGAEFRVVKMTLARRAAAELELAELDELLLGPTGIAFADDDPVTAAKALKEFANENEAFFIKGGLLRNEFLSPERVSQLADIESREVLLSKIAGVFQAPMANLAGLLAALPRNTASVVKQLIEKKEAAEGSVPTEPADDADAEATEPADVPETAEDTEPTGEAVAEDAASAEEVEAAEPEDSEETQAEAEASAVADDGDDGDDTKSKDEDPAEDAEEE